MVLKLDGKVDLHAKGSGNDIKSLGLSFYHSRAACIV